MEDASYSQNNYLNSPVPTEIQSSGVSFIDWIRSIRWYYWLLMFIILAFLGFNILTFISSGASETGSILSQVVDKIKHTGNIVNTIKNIIFTSASGTKSIIDSTASASDNILEKIQESTKVDGETSSSNVNSNNIPTSSQSTSTVTSTPIASSISQNQGDTSQNNTLNKALNTSAHESSIGNMDYQADDSLSSIQKGGSKGGWCLIGEDRGFRSCASVENSNQCMSGEIFPTNEICVNPRLRA
jgi:hypothetical protein